MILYFKQKYPLYKFITVEEVENICKRYELVYGLVSLFKGFVPEKNLQEIKNFKIDRSDRAVSFSSIKSRTSDWVKYIFSSDTGYEVPLFIAAPIKDMNTEGMKLEGYKLVQEIPDPVVLQPVVYNPKIKSIKDCSEYSFKNLIGDVKIGFLIVTAWGDEASDELVVNEINN